MCCPSSSTTPTKCVYGACVSAQCCVVGLTVPSYPFAFPSCQLRAVSVGVLKALGLSAQSELTATEWLELWRYLCLIQGLELDRLADLPCVCGCRIK